MATDAGRTDEHPTTPTPRRRWFQFSLRTLMVFVVVTSVPLGWLGIKVKEARKQRESVRAIEKLGGTVDRYGFASVGMVAWLGKLAGEDLAEPF
jgi:hypothetical protein